MTASARPDHPANAEQADFWNGDIARRWLAHEAELEVLTREPTRLLEAAVAACPGQWLIEVGCGAGELSIRLAHQVAPGGRVMALDISAPLLERARARAGRIANLDFQQADAQVADLPRASFDAVVSNFGIMFFADPVAALANLRGALRPGGRLTFVCFGAVAKNSWFRLPRAAAVARLGQPPTPPPGAPGPLAFSDRAYVIGLMEAAGFIGCTAEAHVVGWFHPGGPDAAARLAMELGPAAFIIRAQGGSDADRAAIQEETARAFAPYAGPSGLRLPVEVLLYRATNPDGPRS